MASDRPFIRASMVEKSAMPSAATAKGTAGRGREGREAAPPRREGAGGGGRQGGRPPPPADSRGRGPALLEAHIVAAHLDGGEAGEIGLAEQGLVEPLGDRALDVADLLAFD